MTEVGSQTGARCVACGAGAGAERGEKNGFRVISCRGCGTLYTSPAQGAGGAHDYDSYYGEENLSVPDFINARLDEIVADFAPYRQNGRLLDVGFGAGALLEAAGRAGWEAWGVEVSRTACEHVRARGFEVFCGELAAAGYPENHFDVVTASEVLEHVSDPRAMLRDIARVVRPGGLLWMTTPHGRGVSSRALGVSWSVVSPPEHLQLFSTRSVRALLAAAGFRKVRVATHGVNPSELLSALRGGRDAGASEAGGEGCRRVEDAYALNEAMSRSPARRALKNALNAALNASRLGDSLKVWAEK